MVVKLAISDVTFLLLEYSKAAHMISSPNRHNDVSDKKNKS